MPRNLPFLLLALAVLLPACAQQQTTWTLTDHPATPPNQIQILAKTSSRYERLGTIIHLYTPATPWQDGADATPIFQELLAESAAMGANTLLLVDDTTMADTSITMTYQGNPYTLPVRSKTKTILAQAIFIIKE